MNTKDYAVATQDSLEIFVRNSHICPVRTLKWQGEMTFVLLTPQVCKGVWVCMYVHIYIYTYI